MKTTLTAPPACSTRWMRPPAPRVSSSGWGTTTRRRVAGEKGIASNGGCCSAWAVEASKHTKVSRVVHTSFGIIKDIFSLYSECRMIDEDHTTGSTRTANNLHSFLQGVLGI